MLHSCYRRTGGLARVGEPDDRALSETAEGLREPAVGRSGEGGSSPGMGTRVRSPSTTKARGPGETTRHHGPRHVRARASDEVRGSVPGDRLGAGHRSRVVTGQSGWKSGSHACGGAPTSETAKKATAMRPTHAEARPARYLGAADIARGPRASSGAAPSAHQPEAAPARGAHPSRRTPSRRRARPRMRGDRDPGARRRCRWRSPSPHVRRPTQEIHLTHRFGPCLLPRGAPGVVPGEETGGIAVRVWPTSYRPDRFAGVSQVVRG